MLKTARKKLSNAPPELNSQRWRKNRREASREKGAWRWRGWGGGGVGGRRGVGGRGGDQGGPLCPKGEFDSMMLYVHV